MASPLNGGPAVVRIHDAESGPGEYQFEITWDNTGPQYQGYQGGGYYPPTTERRETDRGRYSGRFGADQAVAVCRDSIRQQAMERFGTQDVNITRINIDNNPGRNDWVVGTVAVRRGWRDEQYPFSCSVNLDNGRLRTAQIEAPDYGPNAGEYGNRGYAARDSEIRAVESCRDAVVDKLGSRVQFGPMDFDQDGDLVTGTAQVHGRSYDVSCRVDAYSGAIRDVEVRRQ